MSGKIVIVEGVDQVGKTTLCRQLEKLGFFYFKDSWNILEKDPEVNQDSQQLPLINFEYVSLGKLDTSLSMLKLLTSQGINVVVDRLHISELVYGTLSRAACLPDLVMQVDKMLSQLDCIFVHMKPTNYREASKRAGYDVFDYDMAFINFFQQSLIQMRFVLNYTNITQSLVHGMLKFVFSHDIYFASPFFNPEQIEREEALIGLLRSFGFSVFSPKEECLLTPTASIAEQQKVFNDNLDAIKESMFVFVVTDGRDIGTIWEAGYSSALNKPIIYFAETLGTNKFNIMLAQSGKRVFLGRDELSKDSIMEVLMGESVGFKGLIE